MQYVARLGDELCRHVWMASMVDECSLQQDLDMSRMHLARRVLRAERNQDRKAHFPVVGSVLCTIVWKESSHGHQCWQQQRSQKDDAWHET